MLNKNFCIDGAVLRYIAVFAMFTDHLALCTHDFIPLGLYLAGRAIGRIAYPIFAYCLVAGYRHTHDIKRYAGRIAVAAVISEIPFNLMVGGTIWYPRSQNVMGTLLIGLGMLWGMGRLKPQADLSYNGQLLITGLACAIAIWARVDYEWEGILIIAALNFLPEEWFDIPRGNYPRYLFYAFYPAHMLLLVLLRDALGQLI